MSIMLYVCCVTASLGLDFARVFSAISSDTLSRVFFFSGIGSGHCFFGRFLTNIFAVVTVAKLSRSVVRHGLDYGGFGSSRGGVVADNVSRFFVVLLFLVLKMLLCAFASRRNVAGPTGDSRLFPVVTAKKCFPVVMNVLFVVKLVSSTCSTTKSTLATLAASFAMSVLKVGKGARSAMQGAHGGMRINVAVIVKVIVFVFGLLGGADIVSTICVLTDCACNPVLKLFTFNVLAGERMHSQCVPLMSVLSPVLYFVLRGGSRA